MNGAPLDGWLGIVTDHDGRNILARDLTLLDERSGLSPFNGDGSRRVHAPTRLNLAVHERKLSLSNDDRRTPTASNTDSLDQGVFGLHKEARRRMLFQEDLVSWSISPDFYLFVQDARLT